MPVLSSSAFKSRIAALGDLRILRISADELDGPWVGAVEVDERALWASEATDGVERRVEAAPEGGELMYADSWARKCDCRLDRDSERVRSKGHVSAVPGSNGSSNGGRRRVTYGGWSR